jgi:hypothetical protein
MGAGSFFELGGSCSLVSKQNQLVDSGLMGSKARDDRPARTAWHTHPLGQTLIGNGRFRLGTALRRPD